MSIKKLELLSAATLLVASMNANAFNNGDIIGFDRGVKECLVPGLCEFYPELEVVTRGSYFAVDINGNGAFEQQERVPISPGPDGGIVLGMLQPGPGIDQPWSLFENQGIHRTTVTPVTQNPDGSLDFSGWEVLWDDIVFPFGSGGAAMVSCGGVPCTVNGPYRIDYTAMVMEGGFTGMRYQLHLENIDNIPSVDVSLSITGGNVQECTSTGGHNVTATASVQLFNGAELDRMQWTVDGQEAGMGASISPFLSLGAHNITVMATSITGQQDMANTSVTVVDRTAPVINASFVDNRSGAEISSIDTKSSSFVDVQMNAVDTCDASPSTSGIGGFVLNNGDTLKIQGNLNKVELNTSVLEMEVKAVDGSNNKAVVTKTLNIMP